MRNPDIALKYGINGYLEVGLAPGSSKSLAVTRGGEATITILLHFVSYTANLTEVQVKADPKGGLGLGSGRYYSVKDERGNIIGTGIVNINDLVSYNPSGVVTIRAGQSLPVTVTVRIPADFPDLEIPSFRLDALGILPRPDVGDVALIDQLGVTVYVQA